MKQSVLACLCALAIAPGAFCQESASPGPSAEEVFQAARFDQWAGQGPRQGIHWRYRAAFQGLSVHQRMVAHLEMQIPGSEIAKRGADGRLVALVQVEDQSGRQYRDYGFVELKEVTQDVRHEDCTVTWGAFALPGTYRITFALYDERSGEHDLAQTSLRVPAWKDAFLVEISRGLPGWEFWAPLTEPVEVAYRPDIESRLHLTLATRTPVRVEVLADLTASNAFRGSSLLYSQFLALALPLVKDLSQIEIGNGSLEVTALDLRQRKVTFQQDQVQTLDWKRLKPVLASESGLGVIDVKALQPKREDPAFLREEVLRQLQGAPGRSPASSQPGARPPYRVFIVVGSSMDSYGFQRFPPIGPAQAENGVVYYLQYVAWGGWAKTGNVREMFKPLPVHAIQVHTAEDVEHALETILKQVGDL